MALTITNHLIRGADAPHIARFGDGAGTVIRLPGRVLTEGRAAATKTAGAASQIPADCNPEVYDEGFWSRLGRAVRPYRTSRHCARIGDARGPGDGVVRGWLWRCRGWWSKRGGG
jgi:hypothetical protein